MWRPALVPLLIMHSSTFHTNITFTQEGFFGGVSYWVWHPEAEGKCHYLGSCFAFRRTHSLPPQEVQSKSGDVQTFYCCYCRTDGGTEPWHSAFVWVRIDLQGTSDVHNGYIYIFFFCKSTFCCFVCNILLTTRGHWIVDTGPLDEGPIDWAQKNYCTPTFGKF